MGTCWEMTSSDLATMRSVEIAIRYLKEEGLKPFLSHMIGIVFSPVLRFRQEVFYSRLLTKSVIVRPPNLEILLKEASLRDLRDLERVMFLSSLEIKNWLLDGKKCFIAKVAGKIVHYSWLSYGIEYVDIINKNIELIEDEVYIHTCRTLSAYRGKGIYPFVLDKICEYVRLNGYSRIITCANFRNTSSIKSFEKAGFKKIGKITYLKIFTFSKYRHRGILPKLG